jgi:predicted MFS family arabinose efflux permease
LLAMMVVGAGTGLFLPGVVPIIAALSGTEAVKARTQSLRYLLLNLGLGLGAALGGFILNTATDATYRWLFAANGASCALYALILAVRVRLPRATGVPPADQPHHPRFRPGLSYLLLLAAQLLIVTFGLAQVESGVPLAIRADLGASTGLIGVLYGIATLIVLVGQLPMSRLVERVHKTWALICMGLLWAGAWLLGNVAGTVGQKFRVGVLVVMMVTFAVGECAYSPAFYTLVEKLAPAGTLGRSSGAAWATFQVGNTIGPSVAVFLVGGTLSFWVVLSAMAGIAALLMLVIDRRMHAHPPTTLPRPAHPPQPESGPGRRSVPSSLLVINPARQTA